MTPELQRFVDALGGDAKQALAIIKAAHGGGDSAVIAANADRVRQATYTATYRTSEGRFVTYHDAKAWTPAALAAIYVDRAHPYIRLIMHNKSIPSGYRTTTPIAVPGATALDLLNREGSAITAVARVVVGKRLPSKAG